MSVDITVSIEYECWCDKCGKGLCDVTTVREEKYENGKLRIFVSPCPVCEATAKAEGYQQAKEEMEEE